MQNLKALALNWCLLSLEEKKKAEFIYKNNPGATPLHGQPKRGTFNTVSSISEMVMYILFFQREPCTLLSPLFTLCSVWRQGPADSTIADQRTGECFSLLSCDATGTRGWICSRLPDCNFLISVVFMSVVLFKLCWLCASSVQAVYKSLFIQAVNQHLN